MTAAFASRLPFGYQDVEAFLGRVTELGAPAGREKPSRGEALADVCADVASLGLPPGSAVILALASGRALLTQYFAVLLNGLVPMPVPPATPATRLARIGAEVGAGAVLGASLDPARFGAVRTVPVGGAQAVGLADPLSRQPGTVLMATSGTSGMFSACLHRVDSLLRNARRHTAAVGLRGGDTILVSLPLYYSYALVAQALAAFQTGAALVLSGPPFSPADYLAVLDRCAVTASSLTPTGVRAVLAHGARFPRGLRMLTIGGDQLGPAQVAELVAGSPGLELYLTYGLTEAGPRVATLAAHAEPASRYASAGLPLPGVTAALRPVPGHPLEEGELLVGSDTVLVEKIGGTGGRTLVRPGVVATGDLFRIDADGYLYFTGRLSDFVVVRGEKISLQSVRQLVQAMEGILRCATTVRTDAAGETGYDLTVQVVPELAAAEQARRGIRRAVLAGLLPAERPGNLLIEPADLAAFRK
jgi:acyl-CoA synthetase (AMP-forming)/AMP-acid ligase II